MHSLLKEETALLAKETQWFIAHTRWWWLDEGYVHPIFSPFNGIDYANYPQSCSGLSHREFYWPDEPLTDEVRSLLDTPLYSKALEAQQASIPC